MERKNNGYETDDRIMDAIEAVTGASLDCDCSYCEGGNSHMCKNPAVFEWHNGLRIPEIITWLDENCDDWRERPSGWGQHDLRQELALQS